MKFTKEEAYKELVERMTAKGEKLNLSGRSINEQLETLISLVANDETELQDFITNTLPVFKTADANVRNDVSVGINKYKEENPIKKETEVEPSKKADQILLDRLEAMEKELANAKREKQIASTRKEIATALKNKGVKDEDWVNDLLSEITINDNFDIESKVESYAKLYNKSNANVNPNVSPQGTGGGKQDYLNDTIKQAADLAKSQALIGN